MLLKNAGLSEADIEVVDLSAEDASQAFMMQEVDAAVTKEPFLTEARNAGHGHLLADTSEQPGLLVDCLMTRADVFDDRKGDFQAVARAWDAAVRYVEAHPDEANEIMARHPAAGWIRRLRRDPEGVGFYDAEETGNTSARPTNPADLRDHAVGDRRLVEPRDAERAGFARRRDPARHLGRVAQWRRDMSTRTRVAGLVAALVVTAAGGSQAAHAEPLRIGYNVWVGFGPLFVAQEKGLFAAEGVEVELINMAIHEALYAGLLAGQIDVSGATVDDMLPHFDPEQPYACVMATDESLGADGIVATKDIKSIADLKGKVVAFPERTVSEFFLNVLLREAGLGQADIEHVELTGDDAGDAFLMQEVDAAVTWEPFLTRGKQSEHGHLLANSSERPGLLVTCLLVETEVLDDRREELQALARAWDAAVHYVEAHPDEANQIMARNVGGWLEDPAVFAETLKGVRFYNSARNREYFGTPDHPGQIYQTSQYGIDIWSSLGALKTDITPADVIRHDLWVE